MSIKRLTAFYPSFDRMIHGFGAAASTDHILAELSHIHGRSVPFTERRGVCRDYAHLAVTLCRWMNIPARYCAGYLGDIEM